MDWIWWLLGTITTLVVIDRIASWTARRGWIYWRKGQQSKGAGPAVGVLMDAFQPSRRIIVEESRFQQMRVDEAGVGAAGPKVDLDGNRAWLQRPGEAGHAET